MASLLPYAIDPVHSNIYFLISREAVTPSWECAGLWSDFGGAANPDDEDVFATCAREFHEESNRIVPYYSGERLPRPSGTEAWKRIAESLRAGNYTLKLDFHNSRWGYTTVVKQIPWMPQVVEQFSRRYLDVAIHGGDDVFVEKDSLQWVSPERLFGLATRGSRGESGLNSRSSIRLRPHFKKRVLHVLRHFPSTDTHSPTHGVKKVDSPRILPSRGFTSFRPAPQCAPYDASPVSMTRTVDADASCVDAIDFDPSDDFDFDTALSWRSRRDVCINATASQNIVIEHDGHHDNIHHPDYRHGFRFYSGGASPTTHDDAGSTGGGCEAGDGVHVVDDSALLCSKDAASSGVSAGSSRHAYGDIDLDSSSSGDWGVCDVPPGFSRRDEA